MEIFACFTLKEREPIISPLEIIDEF